MTIQLHSGALTVTPQRFKESEGKQGFVVPTQFRSLKTFDVSIDSTSGGVTLTGFDVSLLKGYWRTAIDHAPFKPISGFADFPTNLRCIGFLQFDWGDLEPITWHVCK